MPVVVHADVCRPSQEKFAEISYDVMHHLFAIHNEFGRFLREETYKQELAARRSGLQLEVPIDVSFGGFAKRYEMDVLADRSAVFELKTVEALAPKHDAQLLNYLLLAGDWGTGLELPLYTEAMTELLGGKQQMIQEIEIVSGTRVIGKQKVHLASPNAVFCCGSISPCTKSRSRPFAGRNTDGRKIDGRKIERKSR